MVNQNFIDNINALNQGELIDFDALELKKIIEEFPCFNSAYLLQAIALKQQNEEEFQEVLPSIAVRVLNRAVLYDRVTYQYTSESEKETEVIEEPIIFDEEVASEEVPLIEVLEEQDLAEVVEIEETKTTVVDQVTIISPVDEEKVDEELEAIIAQSEVLEKENVSEKILTHEEELEDLDNLINEVKAKSKKQAIVSKVKKTIKPTKIEKSVAKKEKNIKKTPQNLSFSAWLKNKKSVDQKEVDPPVEKIVETEPESIPIDMAASHEAALFMEVKKSSLKLEDFLVDQIEKKQERKVKSKKDFTHAVSETYAKILVKQGKIKEAIDVYKELSIKYQKKSYNFANQIDK